MSKEGVRPAWLKRFHGESLSGLKVVYWIDNGSLVVEKFGIRRSALLEDIDEVWKILTNDMELNGETAEKILGLVATKTAVAGGEVF